MPNRLTRYCEGIMEAAWLLALILTPLFFNIYSTRVFEPDKATLLRSLACLAMAGWLGKAASNLATRQGDRLARNRLAELARVPMAIPVLAFAVIYALATLLSAAPLTSLLGSYPRLQGALTTLAYLALFATAAAHLRRRAQVERLLTTAMLTSLPVSLYGILQHYHFDPMPWGADVSGRVTGSMGNAGFLGAYLILVIPLMVGRLCQIVQALWTQKPGDSVATQWLRLVIYVALLGLNLTALAFTRSSASWFGLAMGLLFFGGMLAFIKRSRAVSAAVAGLAVLTIIGAMAFGATTNQDGSDGSQVSPRVRVLISQGVAAMMKSSSPLTFPDGHTDTWAVLRPLIGYGPETLYVTFNRFYPPELGWQGVRGASPDRAYNETLDALATTGWLGVAVYLALFATAFLTAFRRLGMLSTSGRTTLFWGLALGGVASGAAVYGAWQGPEAVGLGLGFGLAAGMGVFVTLCAWQAASAPGSADRQPARDPWLGMLLASLSAVILAHFIEINLGIAITPTRTYWWLLLAVLWALSSLPEASPAATSAGETESAPSVESESKVMRLPWEPVVASAAVTAVLLMVLGFDFVASPSQSTQPFQIVIETLTMRNSPFTGPYRPFGILALTLATWTVGGVLAYAEESSQRRGRPAWRGVAISLAMALLIGGSFWCLLGWQQAALAAAPATSTETLARQANTIANWPVSLCLALLLIAAAWAAALPSEWPASQPLRPRAVAIWAGSGTLIAAALIAATWLGQRGIAADSIHKTAMQFDQQNQLQVAIPLFQQAAQDAPLEAYHHTFLGRAYLNLALQQSAPADQVASLTKAESSLKTAQSLDPLNTDNAANLARLYEQWAQLAPSPAERSTLISQSEAAFAVAVQLSPNNVLLWNEFAELALQLAQAPDEAQQKLDRSLALDTTFGPTYQVQGDILVWRAGQTADNAERKALADQAILAYQTGIGKGDAPGMHAGLGQAYEIEGLHSTASQQYLLAIQMTPPGSPDLWQLYRQLGEVYEKAGDFGQARLYGQKALDAAPAADRAEIQAWLKTLP